MTGVSKAVTQVWLCVTYWVGDIINHNGRLCSSVVHWRQAVIPLLSGCVPDLKLDRCVIQTYRLCEEGRWKKKTQIDNHQCCKRKEMSVAGIIINFWEKKKKVLSYLMNDRKHNCTKVADSALRHMTGEMEPSQSTAHTFKRFVISDQARSWPQVHSNERKTLTAFTSVWVETLSILFPHPSKVWFNVEINSSDSITLTVEAFTHSLAWPYPQCKLCSFKWFRKEKLSCK